jgi:predicted esterase
MFPNGYDSVANDGKKYPLILHFAGRGEAGEDNELQLRHAGQGHKKAIEEDRFPGYALFPQVHNVDGFATDNDLKKIVEIIELLIRDNKVDANRIYVHGLSAGGESTWRLIRDYPYLFAAALPMSWSHNKFVTNESVIKKYIHIPIWISQGGKDDFPPPAQTNNAVSKIRDKGGNIRYKYLPKAGHGTWTAMYTAPDFFPFMLRHSKLSIHVYHGQTSFCPGEAIDVTLGISLGFDGYEWEKDEQPFAAGASKNEIQVTEAGAYRERFKRGSEWTAWSEPVMIDNNREVLPTLEISTNGKTRNLVTALDGSTSVILSVPEGYQQYNWKKNNNANS